MITFRYLDNSWGFPCSLTVKTQHCHCCYLVQSLVRELPASHAAQPERKKKKKSKLNFMHFLLPSSIVCDFDVLFYLFMLIFLLFIVTSITFKRLLLCFNLCASLFKWSSIISYICLSSCVILFPFLFRNNFSIVFLQDRFSIAICF